MKPTFIIWAPSYSDPLGIPLSGGAIALHLLAHEIAKLGYNSFLFSPNGNKNYSKNPQWLGEILPTGYKMDLATTVVIYPEIVCGNPLKAKHVVRWLLNTPGVCAGDGIYEDTDMVFLYWDYFTLTRKELVLGELRQFTVDFDIFKDLRLPRSGQCHAVKKGRAKFKQSVQHDSSSVLVDIMQKPELQEVFNAKETFISYDHVTHLSIQAALAGCTSIVIPDGINDKAAWKSKLPICKYGVAYGFDDVEWAKSTIDQVRPHLESLVAQNLELLKNFIGICTERCKQSVKIVVDVVIPSKTEGELIATTKNCIQSLRFSEKNIKFNVILVESSEEIKDVGQDSTIKFVGKFNYNKAMNMGALTCSNEWIVLANNDLIFHPEWFTNILQASQKYGISSLSPWNSYRDFHDTRMPANKEIHVGYMVGHEVAGWCLVAKRELFDQMDLSEHVSFWYSDDVYVDELRRLGVEHALVTSSKVSHLVSQTLDRSTNRADLTFMQKIQYAKGKNSGLRLFLKDFNKILVTNQSHHSQFLSLGAKLIDLSDFWCTYAEYDVAVLGKEVTKETLDLFKKKNIAVVIIDAEPDTDKTGFTEHAGFIYRAADSLVPFESFCRDTLIIVTTFNRPEVTRMTLSNLEATRRQAALWVYDDSSNLTEAFLKDCAPKAEKIMKLARNISVSRLRFHVQNLAYKTDYRYVYHTDNDTLHDPYWLNRLYEISLEHNGPIGLYNAVPHLCWTKSEDKINNLAIRDACPGVSFFYDQVELKARQNPMEHDPYVSMKMVPVPVWDYYIGDLFTHKQPASMVAISSMSYVEHFGASGLHSRQVDRAINPTRWLIEERKKLINSLPFAANMASPMFAEPAVYIANIRSMGDLIAAAPVILWAITNLHKDGQYKVLAPKGYEELFKFIPADKISATTEKQNFTKPWHLRYLHDKFAPLGNSIITAQKMHLSQFASIKFTDRIIPSEQLNYIALPDVPVDHFGLDFSKAILLTTTYCCAQRFWAPGALTEIIDHIKKIGYTPVYLGKRTDDKNGGVCGTEELPNFGVDLRDKTSISELYSIMKKSKMIVGIDNGLIHLAGTTSIPIVCGYTITNPETRIPLRKMGKTIAVVPSENSCRYCLSNWLTEYFQFDKCYYGHNECVQHMTADKFIAGINEILGGLAASQS